MSTVTPVFPKSDLPTPIVFGSGFFPPSTLRLAFQYGINTIDTAPFYNVEHVFGEAFEAIKDEFPRDSYYILTKVGRYGQTKPDGFDYSKERILSSIKESCEKMKTDHVDGVYLHDAEFVADDAVGVAELEGVKLDENGTVSKEFLEKMGLKDGEEGLIRGPGDQRVLDGAKTLFELKEQGKIKWVGISGYSLPTLLRLSRLIAYHHGPCDILQTFCHHTLQNDTLPIWLPLLYATGAQLVTAASPLAMGLLATPDLPVWHPAPPPLRAAASEAFQALAQSAPDTTLAEVALGFGLKSALLPKDAENKTSKDTVAVVGLLNDQEVHVAVSEYVKARDGTDLKRRELEESVIGIFKKHGAFNYSWTTGV